MQTAFHVALQTERLGDDFVAQFSLSNPTLFALLMVDWPLVLPALLMSFPVFMCQENTCQNRSLVKQAVIRPKLKSQANSALKRVVAKSRFRGLTKTKMQRK